MSCGQHRRSDFLSCQGVEPPTLRVEKGMIPEAAPLLLQADLGQLRVRTTGHNRNLSVRLSYVVHVLEY